MSVLAYSSGFSALVWMNTEAFRLIKINFEGPEDSAFILSQSGFSRCRYDCRSPNFTVAQTMRPRPWKAIPLIPMQLLLNCMEPTFMRAQKCPILGHDHFIYLDSFFCLFFCFISCVWHSSSGFILLILFGGNSLDLTQ